MRVKQTFGIIKTAQESAFKSSVILILGTVFTGALVAFTAHSSAFADSVSSNVDYVVNVNSSLTITLSADNIGLDLNPAATNFGTQDFDVTVSTNSGSGYNCFINSTSTSLNNSALGTTIDTLPNDGTTYTSANFPANYYGYRISAGTTGDPGITSTTNFYNFDSGTLVSSSSEPVTGNTSTLTFAAKADYDKPAGNYNNTYTFATVAAPITTLRMRIEFAGTGVESAKICRVPGDCTGSDLVAHVTSSMVWIPNMEYDKTYYLYPTFASGYTLSSWKNHSRKGVLYSSIDSTPYYSTTDTNPYFVMGADDAILELRGKVDYTPSAGSMQAALAASEYEDGFSDYMTDDRDSKSYLIRKINGKLWMVQNLTLGCNGATVSPVALTSDNSNLEFEYEFTTPTRLLTSTTTANYGLTIAAMQCSASTAWYNYGAATAGTIMGDVVSRYATATDEYSICPAGWKLPSVSDFNSVIPYVSATSPTGFPLEDYGSYYIKSYTTSNYWWTTDVENSRRRYTAYYFSSDYSLSTHINYTRERHAGLSVRCVRAE